MDLLHQNPFDNPFHEEFPAIARAPSTEDIFSAMRRKTKKWRGTESVKGALETLFEMKHVEQFNFGPLALDTIREAQKEAIDFIKYGCFSLPYPECVFRCSIAFDNRTVGFHMFNVSRDPDNLNKSAIATVASIQSDDYILTFRADNSLELKDQPPYGTGVTVVLPKAELAYWEPFLGKIRRDISVEDSNGAILTEGALISMGLCMILGTKGVRKERCAPAAKPNKVREARGAPLLPYTTRVYTDVYNKATAPGTGTHASPRPHRRRAHVRHYPATPYRDAYVKPIAAMLVNWDGQPLPERNEYEVHHAKPE